MTLPLWVALQHHKVAGMHHATTLFEPPRLCTVNQCLENLVVNSIKILTFPKSVRYLPDEL